MRSLEKTSIARSRAGWLRNSGLPSSAPSTTKRIWPACVASPALMAASIRASTFGVKMRRSRQRCSSRCLLMRLMPMLPAPRCAAAAKAATAAAEAAAVAGAAAAPTSAAAAAAARPAATCAAARWREIDDHGEDERQGTGNQRDAKTAQQKPGQHGNDAARRNRAEQAPERASQDAADHQREEQPERIERIEVGAVPMRRLRLRQLLAVDQ